MPITATNPFKGRQFPGEVIILSVRALVPSISSSQLLTDLFSIINSRKNDSVQKSYNRSMKVQRKHEDYLEPYRRHAAGCKIESRSEMAKCQCPIWVTEGSRDA